MARSPELVPVGVTRMSADEVTSRKLDEIDELSRRFVRTRDRYIREFWDPKHAQMVLTGRRYLPEHLRRIGWGDTGLSARYSELAAKRATDILRGGWRAALASVRLSVSRHPNLSAAQKHWYRRVLATPSLAGACIRGDLIQIDEAWAAEVDPTSASAWLRTRLLKARPGRPRASRRSWLEVDGALYRPFLRPSDAHFRGAWIKIAGLTAYERIAIPLAGRGLDEFTARGVSGHRPDLRIDRIGSRLRFRVLTYASPRQPDGDVEAGIDKGYRTLITLSLGDPQSAREYGAGAKDVIAREADHPPVRHNRRRIQAHERKVRIIRPKHAKRIRLHCLGTVKRDRRTLRSRSVLRDQVNRALNDLFADTSLRRLHAERLDFLSGRLTRSSNRRLGRWLKGFLHQRLAHKAKLNGVELNVVNAAWTSLTCPRCWFPSKKNRNADRFLCRSCGYTGLADAIAATNVLRRGSDLAITRWTSNVGVQRILEERWRSALNGSAWSSSEPNDGEARLAANNRGLPSEERGPSRSSTDELLGTIDAAGPDSSMDRVQASEA